MGSKKQKIISVFVVCVVCACIGGVAWYEYNRFEPIQEIVKVELGEKLSEEPASYIDANEDVLKDTKLDFGSIDYDRVGEYEVIASCGDKKAVFIVEIEDTVAPDVKLKGNAEYCVVVNQTLKASDIIESMKDIAGIKSIVFENAQIDIDSETPDDLLSCIGITYDSVGEQNNEVVVTDNNGNKTGIPIKITVVEDYLSHVTGFSDISTVAGTSVDCMAGITYDEKVLEVTVDTSTVDFNTVGEYTLTYTIKGDDKVTEVQKTVKVTVTEPVVMQSVGSSNRSGRSGGSGGSYGSGGSGGGSSGGSSGGSGGHQAGDSFTGTQDGDRYYFDGENGNWSEGGSFDW